MIESNLVVLKLNLHYSRQFNNHFGIIFISISIFLILIEVLRLVDFNNQF